MKETLAAFYELRNPSKTILAEEYQRLTKKAKAQEAKCHEVRLALRKYRKGHFHQLTRGNSTESQPGLNGVVMGSESSFDLLPIKGSA
jgi:hypothetical protein